MRKLILAVCLSLVMIDCCYGFEPNRERHDEDLKRLADWRDHFGAVPSRDSISRLEEWVESHPRDVDATLWLARAYESAEFGERTRESWALIKRLEGMDSVPVWCALGHGYTAGYEGKGRVKDGLALLDKAMDAGYGPAFLTMGLLYSNGNGGVKRDYAKASELIKKAGEKGVARAWLLLALLNANSPEGDKESVLGFLRKGAQIGDPEAQVQLAKVLLDKGEPNFDPQEAFKWLSKAAAWGQPEAQFLYGECYRNGMGVASDQGRAVEWVRKAAGQGFPLAEESLAEGYLSGRYEMQFDAAAGMLWNERAAAHGEHHAEFFLGMAYLTGAGVRRDEKKGREFLKRAGDGGIANATIFLRLLELSEKK